MGNHNHAEIADRWARRAAGYTSQGPLKGANLHDEGDSIFSYGSHFEVARILRDTKREPVAFLLNGDRYSVTTAKHQNAVLTAVNRIDLPRVTIPHEALSAAGIELASVEIVHVQQDWDTVRTERRETMPTTAWRHEYEHEPSVWRNSLTGETAPNGWQYGNDRGRPAQETCERCAEAPRYGSTDWETYQQAIRDRDAHQRLRHGIWEDVRGHRRNTGRKRVFTSTHTEWELVARGDVVTDFAFERDVHRHWLGASLIRAAVPYAINQKCGRCAGTGQTPDHPTIMSMWDQPGIGPLTESDMFRHEEGMRWNRQRHAQGFIDDEPLPAWGQMITPTRAHTDCRACSGRGTVRATRNRRAYFLSGFDLNESRPSYFFCELPRGARPTTVEEAYEALKPDAVKLAESMGREVKRQGDIFAIPMPGLTLAQLRADGGTARRRVAPIEEVTVWGRRTSRTVRRRVTEHLAHILDTNHEATEVVDMPNGQTYARGALVHEPGANRRPDHVRLSLGRDWHLVVKNTVPTT